MALRDVMDHAVRVQREVTEPKPLRQSRALVILLATVMTSLAGLAVYSWVARPAFLWGERRALSPIRQNSNARLAMFLLAQRLDAHRDGNGSYPKSLADIGEQATGIRYRLVSDSVFELRATANAGELVLTSTDRRDAFLGNTLSVIARHSR